MPTARRKPVAARAHGIALGTPRLLRRSVAPNRAASPAARENPMTAVVGIWNANPENFLIVCPACPLPLGSNFSQRRKPQMNIKMPSTQPTIESIRSRRNEAPGSYEVVELRAIGTSLFIGINARGLRLPSV